MDKSLELLFCFEEQPDWSQTELSQRLGLHKTIVHRILRTFCRHGVLVRSPANKRYHLGLRVWELGNLVNQHQEFLEHARQVMARLAEDSGESVFLNSVVGFEGLVVLVQEGPQAVKVTYSAGRRVPLYAGASGKVLLSTFSAEQLQDFFTSVQLKPFTPATITDAETLRQDLERIRTQGYAYSIGELDEGVAALAVKLDTAAYPGTVGLSIGGPAFRFAGRVSELLRLLQAAAHALDHVK